MSPKPSTWPISPTDTTHTMINTCMSTQMIGGCTMHMESDHMKTHTEGLSCSLPIVTVLIIQADSSSDNVTVKNQTTGVSMTPMASALTKMLMADQCYSRHIAIVHTMYRDSSSDKQMNPWVLQIRREESTGLSKTLRLITRRNSTLRFQHLTR